MQKYATFTFSAVALTLAGCGAKTPCEDNARAYSVAQSYLAQEFFIPHSAVFQDLDDVDLTIGTYEEQCAITIVTEVLTPDRFGNRQVQRFYAKVGPSDEKGNMWRAIDLSKLPVD